jgi:hypothetical protein
MGLRRHRPRSAQTPPFRVRKERREAVRYDTIRIALSPVRHHHCVTKDDHGDDALDEHADRLWLARAISSPDAWRLRATNSAGLLSAAAAATVAGLLFRDGPVSAQAHSYAVAAAAFYIVAVIAYLVAGVWPSPRREEVSKALADDIWKYCRDEASRIKRIIALGTISAVLAILATGITLILLAANQTSQPARATLSVTAPDVQAAVSALCPHLTTTFDGILEERDARRLRIRLPPDVCGSRPMTLELSRDSVLIRYPG